MKKMIIIGIVVYLGFFSIAQAAGNGIDPQEIARRYSETSMVFRGALASAYFSGYASALSDFQELKATDAVSDLNKGNKLVGNENATITQLLEKKEFEAIGERYLEFK